MTELALLGSLLGMPSIFDPMFPATYASFFGSNPPWMREDIHVKEEGGGRESEDNTPAPSVLSNVSPGIKESP